MKTQKCILAGLIIIISCFFGISCDEEEQPDVESDKAAISNIYSLYASSANSSDFDAWISLWAGYGWQMQPGAYTREGIAEITAGMKPGFELFDIVVDITSEDYIQIYGDIAVGVCNYNIYATPKAGGDRFPIEPDGKALTIFERQSDDTWKILFDCVNTNLPPPSK
jgi:ketosteroid isomerase-like protein